MKKYFDTNSPQLNILTTYNLMGINIHHEINTINSGHFVSIVKNINDKKWYYFDDSNEVIEVPENKLDLNNAYLLFYVKNE
jgi:ubiquitin C-terminal hydrolase